MNQQYLRPPRVPIWMISSVVLGIGLAWLTWHIWYRTLPPMQRVYLADYAKAAYMPFDGHHRYVFLVFRSEGKELAVTDTNLASANHPYWKSYTWKRSYAAQWFRQNLYAGTDVNSLFLTPFLIGACLLGGALGIGYRGDQHRHVRFRRGRPLRGPMLRTRWQFNRIVKGDGVGLRLENRRNPLELARGDRGCWLYIKREHEARHIQTIGTPGSGKTQIQFQLADQAERHGDAAIFYDPHREFIARYYDRSRGDIILNPTDERCVYWNPSSELDFSSKEMAEATSMAQCESLYPGEKWQKDFFFVDGARRVRRYLQVNYRPDAQQEAELMQHADPLIDSIVKGTELEEMFAKAESAQGFRASIASTLTAHAWALAQVPLNNGKRPVYTARDWCGHRRGWIFLTSTQDTRLALRPLQSLWIDSLLLRLMSMGTRPDLPKVWLFVDELASLQYLPQLKVAFSESRKSDLTIVTGFQGGADIEAIYGKPASTMFSAPFTQILLRTSEPEAAEWMSRMVGDQEVEYIRETRGIGRQKHSYTIEKRNERLVTAAEFAGFPDREGILKYGNEVVRIKIPIVPARNRALAFVPRQGEPVKQLPMPNLAEIKAKEEAERQKKAAAAANQPYRPVFQKGS